MFRDTMFVPAGGSGRRAVAFPLALLIHATVAVLVLTLPLIRTPQLPDVDLTAVFLTPPPPAPPAAPPKGRAGGTTAARRIRAIAEAKPASAIPLAVPAIIPDEITTESLAGLGVSWGIEGGVPDDPGAAWNEVIPDWMLAPVLPDETIPLRAGGEITPPRLAKRVDPSYPEIARQSRIEGTVVLEATTDVAGRVVNVTVLRSIPLLDQAAIDAVRQWIYEPMIVNGRPRPVTFTITVRFELR